MQDCYRFVAGQSPLLVSVPHDGRKLAPGMTARMTPQSLALPDTDWHVERLYDFVQALDASVLVAEYSRYVVDLNRAPEDAALYAGQISTGLCPLRTFSGEPVYLNGEGCDAAEMAQRVDQFWKPYHNKIEAELKRIRKKFGYALLLDAHSIAAEVPALFEGTLPDINIGTFDGKACGQTIQNTVAQLALDSDYSVAVNGRFKGGHITRHFGDPDNGVHVIQIELAQHNYMDEENRKLVREKADRLAALLQSMLSTFISSAE